MHLHRSWSENLKCEQAELDSVLIIENGTHCTITSSVALAAHCPPISSSSTRPTMASSNTKAQQQLLLERSAQLLQLIVDYLDEEREIDIEMLTIMHAALEAMDTEEEEVQWGGSKKGKAPNKPRDFQGAYDRLVGNYFKGAESKYDETDFERRFRMPRCVFNRVHEALIGTVPFVHRVDALKKPGIYPLVRLFACLRKLAYGTAADAYDENLEISESQIMVDFKIFTRLVRQKFGAQYLNRCPNPQELQRAFKIGTVRGFPGLFASWDCKHFKWDRCPTALHGQYRGKEGDETLVLEAICDHDLYVWYHFFGEPGSLNDLNILDKSSMSLKANTSRRIF